MKLSRLLSDISDVEIGNFFEQEISSVTLDSRSARRGCIFVAIRGAKCDGGDYATEAYAQGARVFVSERKLVLPKEVTIIISKNARKTLAEICSKLSGNPEKKMMLVGITGTKGKTTTSVLLSKILDGVGVKNVVIGTLGVLGVDYPKPTNTTPDPTVLFPVFRLALKSGIRVAILEVSSQALKEMRVFGLRFDSVGFTGIGKDHIGVSEHPTVSDYLFSKRKLFTSYGATRAVVNYDDAYCSYMSADVPKVVRCGFTSSSDILISDFIDSPEGAHFSLSGVSVSTLMPGIYNARNTAIALALAREITGSSISECSHYVSDVKISGRFESRILDGKNIIIDYAHNADSVREVLSLCRRLFGKRVICVFGSVGERSFARRRELADTAEKYADFSVITSDNPGSEPPISVCADIYSNFKDKTRAKIIAERGAAISYALSVARSGDCVAILGRGHECHMYINGKKIAFSDTDYIDGLLSVDAVVG